MEGLMLKCATAEEWVHAAIACGMQPLYIQQPGGVAGSVVEPSSWWLYTSCIDVDWDKAPLPLDKQLQTEVFAILDDMGRCYRTEEEGL
jgi:hypothetical protein